MPAAKVDLLSNVAATGSAKPVGFGGRYLLLASGTFSGATVSVEILGPDGATYIAIPGGALTAVGSAVIYLPWGCTVRGAVASGTPAGLYLSLYRMEG